MREHFWPPEKNQQLRCTQDATKHRTGFSNESVSESGYQGILFPTFDLSTVPCDTVLLTQERAQVGQDYMHNAKSEPQGESRTSLTMRHPRDLLVGFHSVAFIGLN